MKYYDYHLHSEHSFDGCLSVSEIASLALAKGLEGIMLTDHVEFVGLRPVELIPDLKAYQKDIELARKKYPQLSIGMGMELGLMPGFQERYQEISEAALWDFVIGSAHYMNNCNLHTDEFMLGKTKDEIWIEYLKNLEQLVKEIPHFDVLGHLDLLRRNARMRHLSFSWQEYQKEIDDLLMALISRGKGLEVNTGSLRHQLKEPHPVSSILARYRQLGGEIVTCGSDAHLADSVGKDIKITYDYIKAAGFKHISLFEKRKVRQLPLR
ncbi:MAG: histidinol-phosphatase HisJ family protein [Bacillota bacterium]|jgi:histidinol-phosphatase (PHP family)